MVNLNKGIIMENNKEQEKNKKLSSQEKLGLKLVEIISNKEISKEVKCKKIEYLLTIGADVNIKGERGRSALFWAVGLGYKEIVRKLLGKGADVNGADENCRTPLMFAAYNGDLEIVEELIKNNADVNKEDSIGNTVIVFAAVSGNIDLIKYLIDKGVDVNGADASIHHLSHSCLTAVGAR